MGVYRKLAWEVSLGNYKIIKHIPDFPMLLNTQFHRVKLGLSKVKNSSHHIKWCYGAILHRFFIFIMSIFYTILFYHTV